MIADAVGSRLTVDFVFEFTFLRGDATGDGRMARVSRAAGAGRGGVAGSR
jgi:hypothetical protein